MLITNGSKTRNIAEKQFPEYKAKGYTEVKPVVGGDKAPAKAPDKGNK